MKTILSLALIIIVGAYSQAQQVVSLSNLSDFKNPSKNWSVVGAVAGTPSNNSLRTKPGTGILFNATPSPLYQAVDNLTSAFEHGDMRLSVEFMLPKGANSGIYLMSRYEVQLYDSWGAKTPLKSGCGAIYERWDDKNPEGQKGYEGHAPRQNVSKAPGLWQHLEIEFVAPRFDASGKKTQNARFAKVVLNGVTIHENVVLTGPTRGAVANDEKALAPFMIQGDHGSVAFRNMNYERFDKPPVSMAGKVNYEYFEGKFGGKVPAQMPEKAVTKGSLEKINYRVAEKNQDFLLKFSGKINIPETDTYQLWFHCRGTGALAIDGQMLYNNQGGWDRREVKTKPMLLTAGEHSFEVYYTKDFGWGGRELGVFISRIGMKPIALHEYKSLPNPESVGDIVLNARELTLQRSFVMHNNRKRTHAVNVGTPEGIHYCYDLNQASLLYLWKGEFLNATEMWYERGEPQIATPMGAVVNLSGKTALAYLPDLDTPMPDTLNDEKDLMYEGYRPAGPVFSYKYKNLRYKTTIAPQTETTKSGSIERLGIAYGFDKGGDFDKLYCRIAEGKQIEEVASHLYCIDGSYYVQVPEGTEIFMRNMKGINEILMKVQTDTGIKYGLIW